MATNLCYIRSLNHRRSEKPAPSDLILAYNDTHSNNKLVPAYEKPEKDHDNHQRDYSGDKLKSRDCCNANIYYTTYSWKQYGHSEHGKQAEPESHAICLHRTPIKRLHPKRGLKFPRVERNVFRKRSNGGSRQILPISTVSEERRWIVQFNLPTVQ